MNVTEIAQALKALAQTLSLIGTFTGNAALIAAAEALSTIATNPAEIQQLFGYVATVAQLVKAVLDWLRGNKHDVAAAYLEAGSQVV